MRRLNPVVMCMVKGTAGISQGIQGLCVTAGDPAGIGPELLVRALGAETPFPGLVYLVSSRVLLERACALLDGVPALSEAAVRFRKRLGQGIELVETRAKPSDSVAIFDSANRAFVLETLEKACDLALERGLGLCTGPCHKRFFEGRLAGGAGHTEYLADRFGVTAPLMLFDTGEMRVVSLTRHVPLNAVTGMVSETLLRDAVTLLTACLGKIGFSQTGNAPTSVDRGAPSLFVLAALDPHCGEWGGFSDVDLKARRWVEQLAREGYSIEGPVPADTLFTPEVRRRFWAILCWYHDQAMIPVKCVSFHSAVNVTLGLPVFRTSPAHGVAYDIAWTGKGDSRSFVRAMELALTRKLV